MDQSVVFKLRQTTDGDNSNRTLNTVHSDGKSSAVSSVLCVADTVAFLQSPALLSHVAAQEKTASAESDHGIAFSSDPMLVVDVGTQSRSGSEPSEAGDGGDVDENALSGLLGTLSDLRTQLEGVVGIEAQEDAFALLLVDFCERQIKGKRSGHCWGESGVLGLTSLNPAYV